MFLGSIKYRTSGGVLDVGNHDRLSEGAPSQKQIQAHLTKNPATKNTQVSVFKNPYK